MMWLARDFYRLSERTISILFDWVNFSEEWSDDLFLITMYIALNENLNEDEIREQSGYIDV